MEQDELARQFAATQQQRYGHRWEDDNATDDDEADAAAEAELARQFAATQQQRYATEQPPGANPFSPADYEFSPMKTLVNDGPSEPLFTPTPEVQPQQPAQRYQQPAAAPQQGYQPAQHQPIHHQPVQPQQPVAPQGHQPAAPAPQESLIHPLLMRNGDSRPLQSRPRHCRRWICLPRRRVKSSRWIPLLSSRWHAWWKRDSPISALKRMW